MSSEAAVDTSDLPERLAQELLNTRCRGERSATHVETSSQQAVPLSPSTTHLACLSRALSHAPLLPSRPNSSPDSREAPRQEP